MAIGGYGRAELNPHSDIDFMFLHDGQVAANKPLPYLSKLIDGVLYPLWDIGLKVGHAVRSIDDCVKVANTDMQSKTSLIEARLIVGDEKLFLQISKRRSSAKCVAGFEEKYIAARLEDQATRRAKYGNSAMHAGAEPQKRLRRLARFSKPAVDDVFQIPHALVTRTCSSGNSSAKPSANNLRPPTIFCCACARNCIITSTGRWTSLGKSLQPAIASNLGYTDRSPSKRIEKFMRDLYMHMRNIFLITRTLEQRMALVAPLAGQAVSLRAWLPKRRAPEPVDGFLFVDGEIRAATNRIFRDSPRRLMRAFLHAQQRRLQLRPDLAQLIRNQLSLVNRDFLNDEHVRETFLTILERRGEVAPILRAMHEVNLLGKYIPEFGKLTCLVQHEFYHQYAADEHTLVCLEQLDRIWEAKEPPYKHYAPLFQSLERPGLLYLALLLHDVGKAAAP